MGLTAYRLSKETGIPQTRIGEIIRGKRSISVATALRFARFFGNSPEFWINLQNHFDIEEVRKLIDKKLKSIKPFSAPAEKTLSDLGSCSTGGAFRRALSWLDLGLAGIGVMKEVEERISSSIRRQPTVVPRSRSSAGF